MALSHLVEQVDRRREDASLASGLRVFCLYYWRLLWQARLESAGVKGFQDPPGLFRDAVTLMAQGGRHRAREALKGPKGRFGKPV